VATLGASPHEDRDLAIAAITLAKTDLDEPVGVVPRYLLDDLDLDLDRGLRRVLDL
jgi:hypothetical protein